MSFLLSRSKVARGPYSEGTGCKGAQETFWDEEAIPYLDYGSEFRIIKIPQILNGWTLLYVNNTVIKIKNDPCWFFLRDNVAFNELTILVGVTLQKKTTFE